VIGVNRIGSARDIAYSGFSAIIDPLGRTLAEATLTPNVLVAEVEAEQVRRVRTDFAFLADRRETGIRRPIN
jgi:predicted amidohydrolase